MDLKQTIHTSDGNHDYSPAYRDYNYFCYYLDPDYYGDHLKKKIKKK